jgi:DNA-binding transcriptional MerR regulator
MEPTKEEAEMFTVGEFSRLAQVSKRLLRYRYYGAEQMAALNRILVLKELGLSLDQIQRILRDHISTDEIQGMLLLKKAEIEQPLRAELQRIRKIESRLQSIRNSETHKPLNVVIKDIPAQPVLSTRQIVESFEVGMEIFGQISSANCPALKRWRQPSLKGHSKLSIPATRRLAPGLKPTATVWQVPHAKSLCASHRQPMDTTSSQKSSFRLNQYFKRRGYP